MVDLIRGKLLNINIMEGRMSFILPLFLLFSVLFISKSNYSQNIVKNGSFEELILCPYTSYSYVDLAHNWFSIWGGGGSSDLYNKCDTSFYKGYGVPSNWNGYQYAKHGNGYVGQIFYIYHTIASGEIIETKLSQMMEKDSDYCVQFYVSLSDKSCWATDAIDVYFSMDTIFGSSYLADTIMPSLKNNIGIVADTMKWIKISGIYKSKGNESFITIGSFFVNRPVGFASIPCLNPFNTAYYYIDAISVYPCNAPVYKANCGDNKELCKGNSIQLGTHELPQYEYYWFKQGNLTDTLSKQAKPVFSPDTTTTYVLKVVDFKFDESWDTITVTVKECGLPGTCNVYPNPTWDNITFSFNKSIPPDTKITLYDVAGRLIRKITLNPVSGQKEFQMDLSTLAAGMYHYNIRFGEKDFFSGKVVLVR